MHYIMSNHKNNRFIRVNLFWLACAMQASGDFRRGNISVLTFIVSMNFRYLKEINGYFATVPLPSIKEEPVIEKILRHCGLWKEYEPRPPPQIKPPPVPEIDGPTLDYSFFEQNCG